MHTQTILHQNWTLLISPAGVREAPCGKIITAQSSLHVVVTATRHPPPTPVQINLRVRAANIMTRGLLMAQLLYSSG